LRRPVQANPDVPAEPAQNPENHPIEEGRFQEPPTMAPKGAEPPSLRRRQIWEWEGGDDRRGRREARADIGGH
jgi:hypothetical protein